MQRDKFERVQLPRKFRLNGENSVLIKNMTFLESCRFVKSRDRFSVRTYNRTDSFNEHLCRKTPHLVTTTKKNLFRRAPKMFKDGLWLIVADQVDAKDCRFRGTIMLTADNTAVVEIANGPGTVRTVTNKGKIDESYSLRPGQYSENENLDYCIKQCRLSHLRNVIFEFSYYNIPIGWKNEKFICWEITDDGTGQCYLFRKG